MNNPRWKQSAAIVAIAALALTGCSAAAHASTAHNAPCSNYLGRTVTDQDAYVTCTQGTASYHADQTACVGDNEFVSFGPDYGGQVGEPATKKLIPWEMVDPGTCSLTVS